MWKLFRRRPSGKVPTPDAVRWAYRLFLDREPESDEVVRCHVERCGSVRELRNAFLRSPEYLALEPESWREAVTWGYRLFLDREPESDDVVALCATAAGTSREIRRIFLSSDEFRVRNPAGAGGDTLSGVVLAELPFGGRLFVDLRDAAIGRPIITGEFERLETDWIRANVGPGENAVDVGANVGYFTILLASRVGTAGHVTAIEPIPSLTRLLRRSVAENGFGAIVTVHEEAAGDRAGSVDLVHLTLDAGARNSGGSHLLTAAGIPPGHQIVAATMCRLGDLPLPGRVSFVKMDVEGSEDLVFAGGRRFFREHRPVVLSEMHPGQIARIGRRTPAGFITTIEESGYDVCDLADPSVTGAALVASGRIRTLLCRPKPA